jgi:hypothetical protein
MSSAEVPVRFRTRIIRENLFARCPFSAAIELAENFLREVARLGHIDELVVDSELSSLVVNDFTDTVRRHDALEFRWKPRYGLFPSAQALLTVRPHAPEGTELQFSIAYVPPFGAVGKLFDALIGRYVARFTARRLLRRMAIEVEHRYSQGRG